ncbi:hypothetical protein DES53_102938 [Roseimicrobium gellanilyticum]|uniref:Uncharacterized protein n=1 Tax=Roseimicrobium gellanilyticum TaxID=748857 RepID=A0A366HV15_9BACT|nr:hypothetical protein [Roseimicrobium gellanilyticum]RBP46547.1 hypothetical protein DES53_102938 [Roseimicrobium gellanilyticum]
MRTTLQLCASVLLTLGLSGIPTSLSAEEQVKITIEKDGTKTTYEVPKWKADAIIHGYSLKASDSAPAARSRATGRAAPTAEASAMRAGPSTGGQPTAEPSLLGIPLDAAPLRTGRSITAGAAAMEDSSAAMARFQPGFRAQVIEPPLDAALVANPRGGPDSPMMPYPAPNEPAREQQGFLGALRLRAAWDPQKIFQWNAEELQWYEDESALDSNGAEFGWTQNRLTDDESWTAKGVLFYPMLFNSKPTRQFVLVPSIEFNRDTSTDGTPNEVNSLYGRLGIDINFLDIREADVQGFIMRAAIGYQTDFDFESGQWILEVHPIEMVNEKYGIGTFASRDDRSGWVMPGALRQKVVITPIVSLASVEDIGNKILLGELDDTYGTVGVKASLDFELAFLPKPFNTTKIGAEGRWWTTLGGNEESYSYIDAHIEIPFFGSSDQLTLKAFYREGDTPDTLEEVDLFGAVITAKF